MFYYKKLLDNGGVCILSSNKPPKNKEGLIEIGQEEYETIFKELTKGDEE